MPSFHYRIDDTKNVCYTKIMKEDFDELALAIVEEIPYGMVSTYGHIASLMGYPKNSRHVGKACSNSSYYGEFPCYRVVNSQGRCAPGWDEQRTLLEDEGVQFKENGCVDLKEHLWTGE